ncbi:hypothetical protein G7Y89_g7423 [Cudoniella acicularis]|uniref:Ankyrin n=1 Tax=Cudoniella acicularis TaxID=354080 RepID=A0A8H4RJC1_9HELO|nr:hypothetical protein G7Y89_g7423 [Cudoniella acicularis]
MKTCVQQAPFLTSRPLELTLTEPETFDQMVEDSLFVGPHIDVKSNPRCKRITPIFFARFLESKVKSDNQGKTLISDLIQNIVHLLTGEEKSPTLREAYTTALCEAMARHMPVEKALHIVASVDAKEWNTTGIQRAAVVAAAACSDITSMKALLMDLPYIRRDSTYFGSMLTAAAVNGHYEAAVLLLDHGADPNDRSERSPSAMQAAAFAGHIEIVQLFLARFYKLGDLGHTVAEMLDSEVDPFVIGYMSTLEWGPLLTPLEQAAMCDRKEVVQLLLDRRLDRSYCNLGGALARAAKNGHEEIATALLREGADVNFEGNHAAYAKTLAAAQNDEANMIRFLLSRGVDLNANDQGQQALVFACNYGFEKTVRVLIEAGVDPNCSHNSGWCPVSPLKSAMDTGQDHIVKLLLERGVDPIEVELPGPWFHNL